MRLALCGALAVTAALMMPVSACAHRDPEPAPSSAVQPARPFSPALTDKLDTAIAEAMNTAGIPGALVGIWSPEGQYVTAVGVADTETGSPMKTDFYSRIGSVTKTFTATAVLQLAGEGELGLDDPIGRYVPGVPDGEAITVRQLASMRSGLADYTKADGFQAAVQADPRRDFSPAELLDWAFALPPLFPPGRAFEYSNTNYILLGLLVEKVGGMPLADYLTEHILVPLGMTDTILPAGTHFPDPHAHGYTEPLEGAGPPVDATGWTASITWAAGAMVSTLQDLRIWVPALGTGALIKPDLREQQRDIATGPDEPADFGYGLGVFTVADWVGHNGSVPGYQTVATYLPQREMTLVVMVNTDVPVADRGDPSGVLATAITEVITPDHVYRI